MGNPVIASEGASQESHADLCYERPKLIPLGNARDLLAVKTGTQVDGSPPDPLFPSRPGP